MATRGTVIGVISNIVTIQVDGPVAQNEICYITTGGDRLMAEVIKVVGRNAYVQVFESTRGMKKSGLRLEFTGAHARGDVGAGYAFQELRRFAERLGQDGGSIPASRTVHLSVG